MKKVQVKDVVKYILLLITIIIALIFLNLKYDDKIDNITNVNHNIHQITTDDNIVNNPFYNEIVLEGY